MHVNVSTLILRVRPLDLMHSLARIKLRSIIHISTGSQDLATCNVPFHWCIWLVAEGQKYVHDTNFCEENSLCLVFFKVKLKTYLNN